jgi:hypothetical protein
MRITYTCSCKKKNSYDIPKTDPDLGLLSFRMRCPESDCPKDDGVVQLANSDKNKANKSFSAQEFYKACMGGGFQEERTCSPNTLRALMVGSTILEIDVKESPNPDRSIINSIKISKGDVVQTVHFSISTNGATIYKVTK